jgi:hypothetical protein
MDNPASIEHVETFHPDLTTVQRAQAERLIAAAWVRLKVIPGLRIVSRMEAGTLDPDVVASVIGEMVANVLRNPEGARSRNTTMTIDDYTETNQVTIDHARAEGLLYPTDGMLAMLRENRRGAWTVIPS